jgi:hypothetical protein
MPVIGFTEDDFLRGKLVSPAWYLMEIVTVDEKPSKDGGSTNYPVEGKIIKAEDGSTEYAGVPIVWNFNSKARGFILGFLESLGVNVEPNSRIELKGAEGRQLWVYVEHKTYEGRVLNAVNHKYRMAK